MDARDPAYFDYNEIHYKNLTNRDEICAYLRTQPNGTAHPWVDGDRRILMIKRGDKIVELDITDIDPLTFLNQAQVAELEGILGTLIDRHPQLEPICGFPLHILNPGARVEIPVQVDGGNMNMIAVIVSDKTVGPTFFDAVAYSPRGRYGVQTLTYSSRNMGGATHSGDIAQLLHFMGNFHKIPDTPFTIGAVGYQTTPLQRFVRQQPSVMLVDYVRELIYIIPCPLDAASVGNATLAHLVAARVVDNVMVCDVLPRPECVDRVTTGDCSAATAGAFYRALETVAALEAARAEAEPAAAASTADGEAVEAAAAASTPAGAGSKDADQDFWVMIFMQNGMNMVHGIKGAKTIFWSQGFTETPQEGITALPHIFGLIIGMAAALCSPPESRPGSPPVSIVYCGPMSEANARMVRVMGNAIFFVAAQIPLTEDVEATLNQVDVAATCMAGPNSVVVVRFGDRLFWYRGVRIPGLVDVVPCYGEDVSALFCAEALNAWLATSPVLPWPKTQETTDRRVFFAGRMMESADVIQILSTIDFHSLAERTQDILDFLTQVSVILESAEIKDFVAQIDSYLAAMIEKEVAPFKEAVLEAYATGDGQDIKRAVAELKGARTRMFKVVRIISNALANLDSVRGISKKTQSIARRQRAAKIADNVERTKTMTMEEKLRLFEQYCESMLILALEPSNLVSCLTAIGADGFRQMIREIGDGVQFLQDGRMPYLDPDTFSSLLELTHKGAEHPLAGPQNMAIPQGHTAVTRRLAAMAFPLLRKAIDLRDPSLINWATEANEEWYSLFRIMMRGMFAQATASREFNIPAQSDDLGFFLIHLILCAMESVVSGMSGVPDPDTDWDSTNCEAMRGLFGQLLSLMASTNKTLCPAYLLVYKGAKLKVLRDDEWWVVIRMARVFPYTCWDPSVLMTNIRRLLTITVHKQIVGPPTERMRQLAAREKHIQKERDPAWYAYVRVVVDVVMWSAGHGQDGEAPGLTPVMAATLLDLSPPVDVLSHGTVMMTDFIYAIRKYLQQVAAGGDWSTGFTRTVMVALFSFVKHSGCVLAGDKAAVRARIHAATTVAEYVAIYGDLAPAGLAGTWPEWTTTAEDAHAEQVASVIGGGGAAAADGAAGVDGAGAPELAVALPPPTLSELLALVPGSADAVVVAEALPLMTLAGASLPPELAALMDLIGLEPVPALRAMVAAMLMSWQSYDSSIDAGVSVLTEFRDL